MLVSVRAATVGPAVPVGGLRLWLDGTLGVRVAALVCTARVEEEVEGRGWRTVASVMDSAVEPVMVLLGLEDEVGGGGDVVAGVTVVEAVAFKVFSSVK